MSDYEYYYEPNDTGIFNRARTINNGYREFVWDRTKPPDEDDSEKFWILDTDIVVPKNFLSVTLEYHSTYEMDYTSLILFRTAYLIKCGIDSHNFSKLLFNCAEERRHYGGGFLCTSELFKKVNGFDEEYIGWGAEDSDFYLRVSKLKGSRVVKIPDASFFAYHQWHPSREQTEVGRMQAVANRTRYADRVDYFETSEHNPASVRGIIDRARR
jgi:GT2 family glycosyltransferase